MHERRLNYKKLKITNLPKQHFTSCADSHHLSAQCLNIEKKSSPPLKLSFDQELKIVVRFHQFIFYYQVIFTSYTNKISADQITVLQGQIEAKYGQ